MNNQGMLRRVGLAIAISGVLGVFCFAAWVLAQHLLPFKPYGDPEDAPSPLARSAVDWHLYAGIAIVMAVFVLLNLSKTNRFGFLGGLWRGAVASVGGPFAWVLPVLFGPDAGSLANRAGVSAVMLVLTFLVWAGLGVPLFVGLVAGLLSWPARRLLAGGEAADSRKSNHPSPPSPSREEPDPTGS